MYFIQQVYLDENDAKITDEFLTNISDFRTWLHDTDNFTVNRGFRDVLDLLKSLGIEHDMPSYLKASQSQQETSAANKDRMRTKTTMGCRELPRAS